MTTEAELRRSHSRILLIMAAVVALTAIAGGAIYGRAAATGVLLGGILAWINFRWLDSSTRAMMIEPIAATTPILAMKYVFRYLLIAAVLFGFWYYNVLPVAAMIAGLSSFAVAVVIKGFTDIITTSR